MNSALKYASACALMFAGVASADDGVSGDFDFYVLEQSWQPEFCHGHYADWPGCATPTDFDTNHFTLHGLWPQYKVDRKGKSYPFNCPATCKYSPDLAEDVVSANIDDLNMYWPDAQTTPGVGGISFWGHEWSKHGTCSGLSQSDYLTAAMSTLKNLGTPDVITNGVGTDVAVSDIQKAYGGADMVVLNCEGGNFLIGTSTCWDKDSNFMPSTQIPCANVLADDPCTGDTVSIVAFPSKTVETPIITKVQTSRKLLMDTEQLQ